MRAQPPEGRGELSGDPVVEVGIGPADPAIDGAQRDVEIETIGRDGDVEDELGRGETHETEITIDGEG